MEMSGLYLSVEFVPHSTFTKLKVFNGSNDKKC